MFINREAVHYVKFALSNSPIQVLTRPDPAKLPRSDQDRVHSGWYGRRQHYGILTSHLKE